MSESQNNTKKKKVSKCKQCQFYNAEENNCMVKDVKEFREYSRKNTKTCDDFLTNEKLVMF